MSLLRLLRHQITPLLLLTLCLGLAALLYFELDQPSIDAIAKAAVVRPRDAVPATLDAPGITMPPIKAYTEVLERPLFSETRRPSVDSPAAPVDQRSAAFNLVGTIITNQEKHALIEHGQPPHLERVSEGQDIDGWSVESIRPDRVFLTRADGRIEVKVKDAPGPPGPPTPMQRRPVAANGNFPAIDPATGALTVQAGINLTGSDQPQPQPQPPPPAPQRPSRRQR